jgi:ankyrin repeat protein
MFRSEKTTPLFWAIRNEREATVKLLLEKVIGVGEVEFDMSLAEFDMRIATYRKLHVAYGFILSMFQLAL